jgi:hypothetical protein
MTIDVMGYVLEVSIIEEFFLDLISLNYWGCFYQKNGIYNS